MEENRCIHYPHTVAFIFSQYTNVFSTHGQKNVSLYALLKSIDVEFARNDALSLLQIHCQS